MIEPTGYTALDLVGYTDKGTYAANVYYVKNDLVHYGGNIWRVLIDDTIGITPAEGPNYTLFIGEPTNLVERIIAPLEDNPATVAYQTGRQIIYNDYLYEVIQNIAVGDILIAYEDDPTNANIKLASPVETQVLALKADKVNKSDIANNVTTTTEGKVLDARQGKALQDGKADTSVIAPVESGTTASRAYAAGAHFIKNGAFCTAKTAIAQGEAFTLNTNYEAGTVGAIKWTYVDEKTGSTPISLSGYSFNEVYIDVKHPDGDIYFPFLIPYDALGTNPASFRTGYGQFTNVADNNMTAVMVFASKTSVILQIFKTTLNGVVTDITNTAKIKVYVR